MHIRKAILSDSEALTVLCITVWIDTYCFEGIETPHASYVLNEYTSENLKKIISERTVYVAEVNGLVIGLVVLDEQSSEIETLYVLPRFKGMGAGKALITKLKNIVSDPLFLTCWEGNEAARKFYNKLGFAESGEAYFELDGKKIRNVELTSS